MDALKRTVTVLFPFLFFGKKDAKQTRASIFLFFLAFVFAFSGAVASLCIIADKAYDDVDRELADIGDFGITDCRFYIDEREEMTFKSLGISLILDGSTDESPQKSDSSLVTVFFGSEHGEIVSDFFIISKNYKELEADVGDSLNFDKKMVVDAVNDGRYILRNLIISTSVFFGIVLFAVLFIIILIIAVPFYFILNAFVRRFVFSESVALTMGSFFCPVLLFGLIWIIDGGVLFFISHSIEIAICAAVWIILYMASALLPFIISDCRKKRAVVPESVSVSSDGNENTGSSKMEVIPFDNTENNTADCENPDTVTDKTDKSLSED